MSETHPDGVVQPRSDAPSPELLARASSAIPGEPFQERRQRAASVLRMLGADVLVACDVATVRWMTGIAQEIQWGPAYPFSAGIAVLLEADGSAVALCPDELPGDASRDCSIAIESYPAYSTGPLRPLDNLVAALGRVMPRHGLVAVERHATPIGLIDDPWVDAGPALRALRAVKDPAEIAGIARACDVVSVGQRAFRELAMPGRREIDLYSAIHERMERAAGDRVPVLPDLLSGSRIAEVGRPPTDRTIGRDELVLCDLAIRVAGHWADSCTTLFTGTATRELRRLHDACRRALETSIALARPGTSAEQIDRNARAIMEEAGYTCPHHTGHGVGAGYHEEPRIVPGAAVDLEAGMVLALEPAGFRGDVGMRLEHVVVVADGGARVLTDYDLRLDA